MPVTRARSKAFQNDSAAVNKLPNEILSEVFIHGFSSTHLCQCREPHRLTCLKSVTSVCSLWRGIAVGTSLLWGTISYQSTDRRADTRDEIETFLRRSGTSPLYIQLLLSTWGSNAPRITSLIMGHAVRFRELTITITCEDAAYSLLPLRGPWPCLEALDIKLQFPDSAEDPLWEVGVRSEAPLRRLGMIGSLKFDNIPTCRLQDINICNTAVSAEVTAEFISRCTSARAIRLIADTSARAPLTLPPFDLPSLELLSIIDVNPLSFPPLIKCTNLRDLTVQRAIDPALWGNQLSALPVWPHLTDLALSGCDFPPETIRSLLRAVPSLSLLFLYECTEAITFARALLVMDGDVKEESADSETFVPVLDALVMIACAANAGMNGTFGQIILEMMTRRPKLLVTVDTQCWAGSEIAPQILERQMAPRLIFRDGSVSSESSQND